METSVAVSGRLAPVLLSETAESSLGCGSPQASASYPVRTPRTSPARRISACARKTSVSIASFLDAASSLTGSRVYQREADR